MLLSLGKNELPLQHVTICKNTALYLENTYHPKKKQEGPENFEKYSLPAPFPAFAKKNSPGYLTAF